MFPKPFDFINKREWEWTTRDRATFMAAKAGLDRLSPAQRRRILHGWRAPYAMTSVQAGEVEAVHEVTTRHVYDQQLVPVEGQTDILALGLPYICPYNVNSIMNPILVMCLGLGYFFNLYKGRPLVREGGVLIMSHPTTPEFHPVHHPSYIDFFEEVLAETTDHTLVLYAGEAVETAPTRALIERPRHPYSRALLDALPQRATPGQPLRALGGSMPTASALPSGCAFHPRCPQRMSVCPQQPPQWQGTAPDRQRRCHLPIEVDG